MQILSRRSGLKRRLLFPALAAAIGIAVGVTIFATRSQVFSVASLTPWKCVGGCGAGGSGGVGSDVKWIGNGVSGGLIDAEFMGMSSIGQNYQYNALRSRFSWKPTWTTNLGLTIPIVSKTGSLQPGTQFNDKTEVSGGIADLMVDFSKSFGMEGEYSLMFNLTLPTGQYDIKRGVENYMTYLPTTLQCGGGIYSLTLGLGKTKDVNKGLWITEAYFAWPFALNFHGKNQFINNQPDQYFDLNNKWDLLSDSDRKRFQYHFKPYGENDLGGYTPPSITAAVYYGDRSKEHYVHSYGAKLWVPLGVAWIPAFNASSYDPIPDPNNRTWSVTLHYGLEFSKPEYPIFLSVNKLIESGSSPVGKFSWPESRDLLSTWTFGLGIKTSLFQ